MTFEDVLNEAVSMLRRQGRVSYRALTRQFDLDDGYLTDLKDELLYTQSDVVEEDDRGLVWTRPPQEGEPNAPRETDKEKISRFLSLFLVS